MKAIELLAALEPYGQISVRAPAISAEKMNSMPKNRAIPGLRRVLNVYVCGVMMISLLYVS